MWKRKLNALIALGFALSSYSTLGGEQDHMHHTMAAPAEESEFNPTTPAQVSLSKEPGEEEGKFNLVAKVTAKERTLSKLTVAFTVPRLFGILTLGEAVTDESGMASIPFPVDFPGDAKTGQFTVTAKIVKSPVYLGETAVTMDGGLTLAQKEDPFPREIWSPKTDWYLLLTIPLLIGAVWSVYIFAFAQLRRIYVLRNAKH